jgi:hypothetical protein
VKNANLESIKQANLMMARGGFDPKLKWDLAKNNSKTRNIIHILNSSFQINLVWNRD